MKKNSTTDSKKTLKSIICNVFTSGVTIIVSLISTVVITRIITVADLGIASSFNSLKSILTIICLLSVYISINRMILDIDGNDMNNEVVNGKTRGWSRADYQRVTHFNNSDK